MTTAMIGAVATGAVSAAMIDIQSYMAARKMHGKRVRFDWVLCGLRVMCGVVTGLGLGSQIG